MEDFSVGRMAELNCISKKALRLYHQKGLLKPVRVDNETGYRYYSYDQCSTIDMIQQLQSLGVSLDEIKQLLDEHNPAKLAELLNVHLAALDKEMMHLSIARQNALQLLDSYQTFQDKPMCDQIILEQIGKRSILSFDIFNANARNLNNDAEVFLEEWELNLRFTKQHMFSQDIPLSLFHRIGCRIAQKNLEQRRFAFDSSFVLIDDEALAGVYATDTIPAGKFLTLYKSHYVDSGGSNAEVRGLHELLDYADEHSFELTGDYFGEIIAETPAFLYEGREMLFKLQIPVTVAH